MSKRNVYKLGQETEIPNTDKILVSDICAHIMGDVVDKLDLFD